MEPYNVEYVILTSYTFLGEKWLKMYTLVIYKSGQFIVVDCSIKLTSLLEIIMDTTFDAVSTKPKIHILLSSKVHIVLQI